VTFIYDGNDRCVEVLRLVPLNLKLAFQEKTYEKTSTTQHGRSVDVRV